MLTTLIVAAVLLGLLVAGLATAACSWWLGARWARISNVSFKRAVLAAIVSAAIGFVFQGVSFATGAEDRYPLIAMALFLAALVVTWKVVQILFRTTFWRAAWAWLPALLVFPALILLIVLVVKPFLFEAYFVPTNAMAPTILGDHVVAACPRCGGDLIVSAGERESPQPEKIGICARCLQTSEVRLAEGEWREVVSGDRFFVLKCLRARRWDAVVFRYPAEPSIDYLMRLVGMPGEEIAIRDGELWIDGRVAQRPPELAALRYSGRENVPTRGVEASWGPVRLGEDEYLVLGDFSRRSADARYWEVGAAGHPPYAVPKSHLVGVATHIYWPPSRWRIFR